MWCQHFGTQSAYAHPTNSIPCTPCVGPCQTPNRPKSQSTDGCKLLYYKSLHQDPILTPSRSRRTVRLTIVRLKSNPDSGHSQGIRRVFRLELRTKCRAAIYGPNMLDHKELRSCTIRTPSGHVRLGRSSWASLALKLRGLGRSFEWE